jgi:hypothetical protein
MAKIQVEVFCVVVKMEAAWPFETSVSPATPHGVTSLKTTP